MEIQTLSDIWPQLYQISNPSAPVIIVQSTARLAPLANKVLALHAQFTDSMLTDNAETYCSYNGP